MFVDESRWSVQRFIENADGIWLWRAGGAAPHEERLENFYSGCASGYDSFRKRLLHGREEMFASLPMPSGGVSRMDLGAGTKGENAENWKDRLSHFSHAYLVDLSSSLLKVADQRIQSRGWRNVSTFHGDANSSCRRKVRADVVTCSIFADNDSRLVSGS